MSRRFLGLISVALFSLAFVHTAYAFTSPGNPTGFVNDFANVLAPADKTALEAKLKDFAAQTGNEVSVVTVQNLGGDVIENYAVNLFQAWGIGNKEKDNGVLFLVAIDDRAVRIEVGYGLEGDLPDATANRIIQKVTIPALKNGDYSGGITKSVDAILSTLGGDASYSAPTTEDDGGNFPPQLIGIGVFVIVWLAAILGRSKSWWTGGIVGAVVGVILGLIFGFFYIGILAVVFLIPGGLLFDFIVSRAFEKSKTTGGRPPWWIGGGGMGGRGGFGGGGGFGGFGGGSSGGGGASGRW
ncbi:MAG: TPM domain-containing protein [Candidatus Pacebacteria bacterium]|nr:TPM domain-containing protein [Candidatus Paceibacterota bacterium]